MSASDDDAGVGATVGLVMIVKNEARTLPRLAASVRHQIDRWTIVDTGSTDDTVAVARRELAGVPGEVVEDEWRGYGPSRNVALRAARPYTDWLLTMDADQVLEGDLDRAQLSAELDCVQAQIRGGSLRHWLPFLVRSDAAWEWHGRAHEYLSLATGEPAMARTDRFHVVHHGDGGNRGDKFERELALLEEDFAEDPDNSRTCFYLARTHDDLDDHGQAAEWYRRRLALGGWDEEGWYARWRLGVCLLAAGAVDEGCGVLWRAWGERPWRAEPLWTLATHYRQAEQWRLCWEACEVARRHTAVQPRGRGVPPDGDRLFVHADVYRWRLAYEQSICAYYVGQMPLGRSLCGYLLGQVDLPPEIRQSVEANQRFYR